MITVILAEKSVQAAEYAAALGPFTSKGRVKIVSKSDLLAGEIRIVAPEGHLFEYASPEGNYKAENLPLVDVSFKQYLKKDKESQERFKIIYQEVTAADQVIIGTDPDREGERIAYSILSHIPGGKEKIVKRLWANSMTIKGIQRAFKNLKESSETYDYYLEAEARAQSDWLVGMNLSPVVTLELQKQGLIGQGKDNAFSVGRVQTPTVRLICENDVAIRNFTPKSYWRLQLEDLENNLIFINPEKFLDSEEALAVARQLNDTARIIEVKKEENKRPAPSLFNLSDLQKHAASQWQFSPDKTEELLENLHLKKYLSYPRTEAKHITSFEFDYLKKNFSKYQEVLNCHFEVAHQDPREHYVNEAKIAENSHYALIPTENIPNLDSLSAEERLIYEAVTKQTLLMFSADCVYDSTTVTVENKGVKFLAKGRQLRKLGWVEYSTKKVRRDVLLPNYQVDQILPSKIALQEGQTKPPKRITESQLIGDILPNLGLGTPATRGKIIKNIQEKRYVKKDHKTGQMIQTNRAYLLVNNLYENEFSDPDTTGGWEIFLTEIGKGNINPREFVDAIKEKLQAQIQKEKEEGRL